MIIRIAHDDDRAAPALVCNTRILQGPLTGQPRYAAELLQRMGGQMARVAPARPLAGMRGHAWEQLALPGQLAERLLWSPSTTGPLAVRRQVVTVHDIVPFDHPEWVGPRFGAWYRFLLPRLLPRIAHVIAVSEFTRTRLIERLGLAPEQVTAIPSGVAARFCPQPPEAIAATAAALELPSKHYLLSVGSLEPRKNLAGLLRAWESIHARLPQEIWLVVAGGRGLAHVFGAHGLPAALPPRVHLAGPVPDTHLPALMAGAIAFVYPSFYEGFGLPPLEAMACGVPVITGNSSALPEVAGDAALLVPPGLPEAIGAAMLTLVENADRRQRLAARGLRRAAQFTWETAAQRTLDLLTVQAAMSAPPVRAGMIKHPTAL